MIVSGKLNKVWGKGGGAAAGGQLKKCQEKVEEVKRLYYGACRTHNSLKR